ncbi:hypothetical protein FQN57_002189 [Myotisia sp. PD_48]|nr:hypothetical protein FQN57_002189 [Myotisia sp. PD_48]
MLKSILSRGKGWWTETESQTFSSQNVNSSEPGIIIGNDNCIFPGVDPLVDGSDCEEDCLNCTIKYPAMFKTNQDRTIYGKIKPFTNHVLVATGESDWARKVEYERGSLMEAFRKCSSSSSNNQDDPGLMISASNMSVNQPGEGGDEISRSGNNSPSEDGWTSVLLLPAFLFVDRVSTVDVPEFMAQYIIPAKRTGIQSKSAVSGESSEAHLNNNTKLRSRPCPRDYIVLLCSHKRRDARCGISAPLIKRELERHLRPLGLLRDEDDERHGGVGIFFVSHVGGHKFAANVLIYRKHAEQMIWLARIRPEHCEGIVKHTILNGKIIHPETRLRGGFDRKLDLTSW